MRRPIATALSLVLVLVALAAVLAMRSLDRDDDARVDPLDGVQVDGDLVPAEFDAGPRLDPLSALPDCDRHEDLEAWATTVLDADFAELPQAGPDPVGPMAPAALDEVAATAPVLLATDDGSPAACITALAGPNDLVAWEQRDDRGALIARGAAAPWASNLMPTISRPDATVLSLLDAQLPGPEQREVLDIVSVSMLAGGGLTNGKAFPVIIDGVLGVSMGTANFDVRRQVEVLQVDEVELDAGALRQTVAGPLSEVVLTAPNQVANAVGQRLVQTARVARPEPLLVGRNQPHLLPEGWVACGGAAGTDGSGRALARPADLLCGPGSARAWLTDEETPAEATPDALRPRPKVVIEPARDGLRRASVTYETAAGFALQVRRHTLLAPDDLSDATIRSILESIPAVADEPPTPLEAASGPDAPPTLGQLDQRLKVVGSRLTDLHFTWLHQDGREGPPNQLATDHRTIEASVRDDPSRGVTIDIERVEPDRMWWWQPSDLLDRRLMRRSGLPIVVDASEGDQYVNAVVRCGELSVRVRTQQRDGGASAATELLVDVATATGCTT